MVAGGRVVAAHCKQQHHCTTATTKHDTRAHTHARTHTHSAHNHHLNPIPRSNPFKPHTNPITPIQPIKKPRHAVVPAAARDQRAAPQPRRRRRGLVQRDGRGPARADVGQAAVLCAVRQSGGGGGGALCICVCVLMVDKGRVEEDGRVQGQRRGRGRERLCSECACLTQTRTTPPTPPLQPPTNTQQTTTPHQQPQHNGQRLQPDQDDVCRHAAPRARGHEVVFVILIADDGRLCARVLRALPAGPRGVPGETSDE